MCVSVFFFALRLQSSHEKSFLPEKNTVYLCQAIVAKLESFDISIKETDIKTCFCRRENLPLHRFLKEAHGDYSSAG